MSYVIDRDPDWGEPRFMVLAGHWCPPGLVGAVAKMLARGQIPYSVISAPPDRDRVAMARMLALAVLDRRIPILQPTLMPRRPAFAVLRDDGNFRHQVTRTFAPWIRKEVSRLSIRLLPDAAQILEELMDGPNVRLRPPSETAPLQDDQGRLYEFTLPDVSVDLSGFHREWGRLPRHVVVRREYERDRYMAHLDRSDLDHRAIVIFRSFYQVDSQGRLTIENDDPRPYFWMDRMAEVMHEYALRGIGRDQYGQVMASEKSLHRGRGAVFRAAGQAAGAYSVPNGDYLVKYGKAKHLRDMLTKGKIRLAAAESFDDPSLNAARRDKELDRVVDFDPSILPFTGEGTAPSFVNTPPSRRLRAIATSAGNFYVYCLAGTLRARLFNDFDVDACLVIRQSDEFLRRLREQLARDLPRWDMKVAPVQYFDPLNVSPAEVQIPFWKHFGYAYQEEVRVVAYPPAPTMDLPLRFPEIGSLEDIADLVVLRKDDPASQEKTE